MNIPSSQIPPPFPFDPSHDFRKRDSWTWIRWMLTINISVFVLQHLLGFWQTSVPLPTGGEANTLGGGLSWINLWQGKWSTLITHMFVHGSLLHLLGNLFAIGSFGNGVEEMLGKKSTAKLYLAAGLGGAILELVTARLFGTNDQWIFRYLVGASGAAFGLIFAFATLSPNQNLMLFIYFFIPVRLRAKNLARGLFIISIALWLTDHLGITSTNIAHAAHLGGAIVGWLCIHVMRGARSHEAKRRRAHHEAYTFYRESEVMRRRRERLKQRYGENATIVDAEESSSDPDRRD